MTSQIIQEDDVLDVAAKFMVNIGFHVLALGGNQAGFFSFFTKSGHRKYPDLVAVKENLVIIFEAKVKSADLFTKVTATNESDYKVLIDLISSKKTQENIINEAKRVIKSLALPEIDKMYLRVGLISSDKMDQYIKAAEDKRIILMSVDVKTFTVKILRDEFNSLNQSVS